MEMFWHELLEYARFTPSPLNIQPWKVKILSEDSLDLYYDPKRLIPAQDPNSSLTICALSMFIDTLSLAAMPKGYEIKADFLEKELISKKSAPVLFAHLKLVPSTQNPDFNRKLIFDRHTSRLPYNGTVIDQDVVTELLDIAQKYGHKFFVKSDPDTVKWIMELNRDTIFYDSQIEAIKKELTSWIRYSSSEASNSKDGMSADAFNIPGFLMKFFFNNFSLFDKDPYKSWFQKYYLGTMSGTATVGWLEGPFHTFEHYINAGILFNRFWLELTKHGIYLHPFGSVISNPLAHKAFSDRFKVSENSSRVWMLLRLGYSNTPPKSLRLSVDDILIK